jgi:alpha-beta hydrolase superfamily lysophospholipase
MQDSTIDSGLNWKKISHNTFISTLSSSSDQKIYLKKIVAQKIGKKVITLFLFHDFGSYHARFNKLLSWFEEHRPDIHFILMDFEGHGLSSGSRGILSSLANLSTDIENVINFIPKDEENDKWIFLGQGLGALALLELLKSKDYTHSKIDGLILSNFSLQLVSTLLTFDQKWLSGFLLKTEFLNHAKGFDEFKSTDLLSHTESINKWLNDPLTLKAYSLQAASIINKKCSTLFHDSYFLDKKTLVLTSESKLTSEPTTRFFLKGFKKDLIQKKHYPFLKHDLYNELDNEIIFEDIAKWMGK